MHLKDEQNDVTEKSVIIESNQTSGGILYKCRAAIEKTELVLKYALICSLGGVISISGKMQLQVGYKDVRWGF